MRHLIVTCSYYHTNLARRRGRPTGDAMTKTSQRDLDPAQLAARQEHRERIWREMLRVCRPDSRFHWDFSSFIADFEGSEECALRVRELPAYRAAERLFITPDNATERLRRYAMLDGKTIVMTTYAITRGFLILEPGAVPAGEERYAATLDGMDTYARPTTLAELAGGAAITMLVTGGSAVATNGVRFGKGHGYFDLEWALLSEVGCVGTATEIVDVVHDCQVVEDHLVGLRHDAPVDWIVTPTRTLRAYHPADRPRGQVFWDLLDGSPLSATPPVRELRVLRGSVDA
jgi:5-formyltetrahydrofolate cyclo-ligase